MTSCESLEPRALLSDLLISDTNINHVKSTRVEENMKTTSKWYQVEQTEPLNLSVNTISVEIFLNNDNIETKSDEDVIFVKEYKVKTNQPQSQLRKRRLKKTPVKSSLRRNPVRQARSAKRFKEYTNPSFSEDDFVLDSEDENESLVIQSNEDSEDWTVKNDTKKNKPIKRKFLPKLGRKRKIIKEIKKCGDIIELETLIETNLIDMKNYISSVNLLKSINSLNTEIDADKQKTIAVDIIKGQAALLAFVKNKNVTEMLQYFST